VPSFEKGKSTNEAHCYQPFKQVSLTSFMNTFLNSVVRITYQNIWRSMVKKKLPRN